MSNRLYITGELETYIRNILAWSKSEKDDDFVSLVKSCSVSYLGDDFIDNIKKRILPENKKIEEFELNSTTSIYNSEQFIQMNDGSFVIDEFIGDESSLSCSAFTFENNSDMQ